jgi:hypothetical protein
MDNELWAETAKLLRRRPGWKVQAMATPGARTYWIFASGSRSEFAVTVEDGSINVDVGSDEAVAFADLDDFVAWLTTNRPGSLQAPSGGFLDKLRSRTLFRWN